VSSGNGLIVEGLQERYNAGLIKRVLIVCPLSIMQSAWQNDLFKFAMHRTCSIAHSHSRDKRLKAAASGTDFVICNFDGLDIIKDEVVQGRL
jgi:hypothetical protein